MLPDSVMTMSAPPIVTGSPLSHGYEFEISYELTYGHPDLHSHEAGQFKLTHSFRFAMLEVVTQQGEFKYVPLGDLIGPSHEPLQ